MSVPTILGVPRARPVVSIGVGTTWATGEGGGVWDASNWDEPGATWSGRDPHFVDVTCDVIDVVTFAGRERSSDDWDVGTATITLDNTSGWADYPPTVPSGLLLSVRPGRPVEVAVAVDDAEPWPLWRGYIDEANPEYSAEGGPVVVLECIDAKGEIGRAELAQLAAPVGAAETVTSRVERIAAAVPWPSWLSNFDTVTMPLLATDLNGSAADLLNNAAASGGGAIFGDIDGQLRLRHMDWQTWNADDPPDGVIGWGDGPMLIDLTIDPEGSMLIDPAPVDYLEDPAGTGLYMLVDTGFYLVEGPNGLFAVASYTSLQVCPSMWELANARADFATRTIVGNGTVTRTFDDMEGQGAYGVETFKRTDLETQNTSDLDILGLRWLAVRGFHQMPRVAAVTIDAATDPSTVDVITVVDPRLPSRLVCRHRDGDRDVFNRVMLAVSVEHDISPESWICRIGLDDAGPWMTGATTGRWDVDDWDQAAWADVDFDLEELGV